MINKRIKELVEQAEFAITVSDDPNTPSWWAAGHNDKFEKFAELIVQECISRCNDGDSKYFIQELICNDK